MSKVFYRHQGQWLTLGRHFTKLKKRPGKAIIQANVLVATKYEQKVRIVFVRHRHKRQQLAILSTKIDLADEEIVRIYGKPWDIEVFFKMMKHYLNLDRETQLRDFDAIIGHITIVTSRYVFLVFEQRCHDDSRTLGSLSCAHCDERQHLSLGTMHRLLSVTLDKAGTTSIIAEEAVLAIVDAVMGVAVDMLQTGKRLAHITNILTAS